MFSLIEIDWHRH